MNKEERNKWDRNNFDEISNKIKGEDKNELSLCDFLRIRNFKLQNISRAVEKNIKKITKEAFFLANKDEIEKAIVKLKELDGVGIPIASTILAMKYPEKYCIIDRKVIKQLHKEDEWLKHESGPKYTKDPKVYVEYLKIMRENAKKCGKCLREYEVELYEKE